jgi:hypothetical protein
MPRPHRRPVADHVPELVKPGHDLGIAGHRLAGVAVPDAAAALDRDDEPGQRQRGVRLQVPELDRVDLRLTHNQPGSRARTARSQQRWCKQWAVILLRSRGIFPHRSDPAGLTIFNFWGYRGA